MRGTEKAMIRAMRGVKLTEKIGCQELMNLLGLEETLDGLTGASGVQWYGHVLTRIMMMVLKRGWILKCWKNRA